MIDSFLFGQLLEVYLGLECRNGTDLHVPDSEATVDDFSLCDGHVVVVHLLVGHLTVHVQRVRRLPKHLRPKYM